MTFDSDHERDAAFGRRSPRRVDDPEPLSELSATTSDYLQRLQARIRDFHEKLAEFDAAERSDPLLDSVPVRPPVTGFSHAPATASAGAPGSSTDAVEQGLRRTGAPGTPRGLGLVGASSEPSPQSVGQEPAATRPTLGLTPLGRVASSPEVEARDAQAPRRPESAVTDAWRQADEIRRQANVEADMTRSAAESTAADLRSLAQRDAAGIRGRAEEEARVTAQRADEERMRADRDMRQMWQALEADAEAIQDEVSRRLDRLAQTIEDVREEAARLRAEGTREAETLRTEAAATAERLVAEAEAESRRLIHAAQIAANTVRDTAVAGVRENAEREAREAREHLARQIREAAIVAIKLVDRNADPFASPHEHDDEQ